MKIITLAICFTVVTSTAAHAETVKIGGTGSMIPLLNDLAKAYMKKNPKDTVEVNQKSMGQPGGIAALNSGVIDIAMSGMTPTVEQLALPVKAYHIATVSGVVAISNDVPVVNITSKQLCDIYSGKINNWKQIGGKDAALNAFTRPESDTTKVTFRQGFTCMSNLRETSTVISLPKSKDMFAALETKNNSIGIVDAIALADAAGKFKALKIDGKSHDSSNWSYLLKNHLVVSKTPKNDGVKRFLEFVKSPEGKSVIKSNKAKPESFNL